MAVDPKFFKEGETEFSVFYPKGYVVNVTPGAVALARHQDYQDHRTVGDRVRQFFAGLYGDESDLLTHLLDLAQRGSTMVLAYAPADEASDRAVTVLRPLGPQLMVKYGALAVTDLLH